MAEEQKNYNSSGIKTLRTYETDMADAVRENETSVIKIALAEQKRREQEGIYLKEKKFSFKKFILLFGGFVLILAGAATAYFVIDKNNKESAPITDSSKINSFFSYNEKEFINLLGREDKDSIINEVKSKGLTVANNNLKLLILETSDGEIAANITAYNLISKLETNAPTALMRSFKDEYMIGSYKKDENVDFYLVFKTADYNISYAGMLSWEKSLAKDLSPILNINEVTDDTYLDGSVWKDVIINNRDVRVLYDKEENPIIYYMFINKENLLITTDVGLLKEIVNRFMIKNIKAI